ncbi:hypothetical protein MNBD_BACTEROID05-319 [hydrothermal vent metagenome]|uniref:Uncharacterized protein n=1 Tax=hydrothermal vent metagenome TaxID=652676 RepID=A0A3B0TMM3_9ZZZZ
MIIPIVILDVFLEVYHQVAFRLYNLERIKRSDHIRIDRQRLKYLTFLEKTWCTYCGYANGLLEYAGTIAGETERYWCGVKHKINNKNDTFIEPSYQKDFLEYGDEEGYKKLTRKK